MGAMNQPGVGTPGEGRASSGTAQPCAQLQRLSGAHSAPYGAGATAAPSKIWIFDPKSRYASSATVDLIKSSVAPYKFLDF